MAINYKSAELNKGIQTLAQNAASRGVVGTGEAFSDKAAAPSQTRSNKPGFFSNLGNSVVSAGKGLVNAAAGYVTKEVPRQFGNVAEGIVTAATGGSRLESINRANDVNSKTSMMLVQSFRAGNITRKEYTQGLKDLAENQKALSKEVDEIQKKTSGDASKQFLTDAFAVGLSPFVFGKLAPGAKVLQESAAASRYAQVAAKTSRASQSIEQMAAKIPSLKGPLMGDYAAGSNVGNIVAGVIKKPLLLDSTVKSTEDTLEAAAKGEFGSALIGAALISSGYFKGGPIGLALDAGRAGGKKLSTMAFGKAGFYDALADMGKMKDNPIEWLEKLKTENPTAYAKNIKTAKLIQEFNLSHYDGDARSAAQNIIEWQFSRGRPLSEMTSEQLFEDLNAWHNAYSTIIASAKSGNLKYNGEVLKLDKLNRIGVGAFDKEAKYNLVNNLKQAANAEERTVIIQNMIDEGVQWSQNPNVRSMVMKAAQDDDFATSILRVKTGNGIEMGKDLELPNGYFPILLGENAKLYKPELLEEFSNTNGLSELTDKLTGAFEKVPLNRSEAPAPIIGTAGLWLRKFGLSTQDESSAVFRSIERNFASNLSKSGVEIPKELGSAEKSIDIVMKKLSAVVDEKRQVFDVRQLYAKEIGEALGVSSSDALKIRGALVDAYIKIPLEMRGFGNRLQDLNMAYNPAARSYSRAQSAGRYAFNPFFRSQEIAETEIFSQLYSGGKRVQLPGVNVINNLFRRDRDEMEATVKQLNELGVFDNGGRRLAESGSDLLLGNKITAKISNSQKMSMAGLVGRIAEKRGVSVEQLLKDSPEEMGALLRSIIQYPKKSVLNSSLATTLNVAIFPMRYNMKVAAMTAEVLSRQQPIVQIAMINSLMDFGDWLKSDEGIAWQSTHSEAIGLFKYFTPINSLEAIYKTLTGKVESLADLGALGGLPFGFIGTMLDNQGIIQLGTPYVSPKTGEVVPDYIPESAKARAKQALDDLLMSVFSYPGRTVGLPGKNETVQNFTNKVWNVDKGEEYEKRVREDVTPRQENQMRVIQGINTEGSSNPYQTWSFPPAVPAALTRPEYKPIGQRPIKSPTSGGSSGKKKKVARPMPVAQ